MARMKHTWKMAALAVSLALAAVLVLAGCGDGNDDDNNNGRPPNLTNGYFGETLTISGKQVYTGESYEWNSSYMPYSGKPLTVIVGYHDEYNWGWIYTSEVGTISENGILNLSISGAPAIDKTPITEFFDGSSFKNWSISPNDAECIQLYLYINDYDNRYYDGYNDLIKQNNTSTTNSEERGTVYYLYVDKDVRVTAQGTTQTSEWGSETSSNIDLQFKKGWNAFYGRWFSTYNQGTDTWTENFSLYIGDSSDGKWYSQVYD
jgi:hypothetical protein